LTDTAAPLLSVDGLRVRYGQRAAPAATQVNAVDGVSFEIRKGDTLALVGESGSGKTTTARAVLRLVRADAGRIAFDGITINDLHGESLRRMRRRMQVVFQDPYSSLNPRMRIGDIIAEGMLVHGIATPGEARARAERLLDEVGLHALELSRYPHELSGGQRQRVAIARALAVEPDFLVLDEAVSALDVTTQDRILKLFDHIRASRGLTCLFIAHNLAVVQQVATTVAVMNAGQIVEMAPAARIFASPQHPYTKALLAAVPGRRYLTPPASGSSARVVV
jgi:ABC-type glutathione transport system ATPase component